MNMNNYSFLFELFGFFLIFQMRHLCKEMEPKPKPKAPKPLSWDNPRNGVL